METRLSCETQPWMIINWVQLDDRISYGCELIDKGLKILKILKRRIWYRRDQVQLHQFDVASSDTLIAVIQIVPNDTFSTCNRSWSTTTPWEASYIRQISLNFRMFPSCSSSFYIKYLLLKMSLISWKNFMLLLSTFSSTDIKNF